MKIRPATNSDFHDIRSVVFTVWGEYGMHENEDGLDADIEDLEANYIDAGGTFQVVENDEGRIVGTFGLFPGDDKICELRKMYLLPEVRSKGLGKHMMDRVLERARALGFRRIELETASVLVEAIGLYRRYGFRPISRSSLTSCCTEAFGLDLSDGDQQG